MRHKENIRGGDIIPSPCAGAENQLSAISYNEFVVLFAILCCCFFFPQAEGGIAEQHSTATRCQLVQHGEREPPGDTAALRVWFVDPSHTSEG